MSARNIIPTAQLLVRIPEDLKSRLDLYLTSEVEGRIPHGAHQRWMIERIKDFFDSEEVDLGRLCNAIPPGRYKIRGSREAILMLKQVMGEMR